MKMKYYMDYTRFTNDHEYFPNHVPALKFDHPIQNSPPVPTLSSQYPVQPAPDLQPQLPPSSNQGYIHGQVLPPVSEDGFIPLFLPDQNDPVHNIPYAAADKTQQPQSLPPEGYKLPYYLAESLMTHQYPMAIYVKKYRNQKINCGQ